MALWKHPASGERGLGRSIRSGAHFPNRLFLGHQSENCGVAGMPAAFLRLKYTALLCREERAAWGSSEERWSCEIQSERHIICIKTTASSQLALGDSTQTRK